MYNLNMEKNSNSINLNSPTGHYLEKHVNHLGQNRDSKYRCGICKHVLSYTDGHRIIDICNYEHFPDTILQVQYERIHFCFPCFKKFCDLIGHVPKSKFTKKIK